MVRFNVARAASNPLAALEALLAEKEFWPSDYIVLARLCLKRGRKPEAMKALETARTAADQLESPFSRASLGVQMALAYHDAGMTKQAGELLALARQTRETLSRNLEKAELSVSLALACNALGQRNECRRLLDEALAFAESSEMVRSHEYGRCLDFVLQPLALVGFGAEALQKARDIECYECIAAVVDVTTSQLIRAGRCREALDLVVPGAVDELVVGNIVYYRIGLDCAGAGREEDAMGYMNRLTSSALNCTKKITILSAIADWELSKGRRAKAVAVLRKGETIADGFGRPVESCLILARSFDKAGARQDADRLFALAIRQADILRESDDMRPGDRESIIEALILHGRDELALTTVARWGDFYLPDVAVAYSRCGNLEATAKALEKIPDDRIKASTLKNVLLVLAEQKP